MLPAVCLVAGIATGRFAGFANRELCLLIAACLALAVLARAGRTSRMAKVCLLLGVFFAGAWLELAHRPGPPPVIERQPREVVLLEGCVVEPPAFYPDRTRFVLELEPGARVRVTLYPRPGQEPPRLGYGQRVETEARIRETRNFGNPGAFDLRGHLARRQIYWTASVPPGSGVRVLEGSCGSRIQAPVYALRAAILDRVERFYKGRPYETGMIQALLTGERAKVDDRWAEQFRITGTYHALVISGLHLGVLAAVVVFLLRCCLINPVAALLLASVFGWGYACLTGWQTPIVRAAAGLTLYSCGRFLYRRSRPLNLLAAIAIPLLVIDPGQAFEASFQLSFLSVASLAAIALPVIERTSTPYRQGLSALEDRDRDLHLAPKAAQFRVELRLLAETVFLLARIPERWVLAFAGLLLRPVFYFYELAVVSASVQLGLLLPMAVYFHRFSFAGLIANLAVVPLITLCVPAGLLAVLTNSQAAAEGAAWMLSGARRVVEWHAGWQPEWRVPDPPLWLAVSLAVSLLVLAGVQSAAARWRWAAGTLCGGLVALYLIYPFAPRIPSGELELTAVDVGQGDAFLLALPGGKIMTVDGGGFPNYSNRSGGFDTGEDIVSPYLWSRRIRRLDVVVVSHFHEDHAGGVPALVRNFRPREVWTGAAPRTELVREVEEAARQAQIAAFFSGARIQAVSPSAPLPAGGGSGPKPKKKGGC